MRVSSVIKYFTNGRKVYLRGVIDGVLRTVESEVYPYAFVRTDFAEKVRRRKMVGGVEETDLRDEFGRAVSRYWCWSPSHVAKVRDAVGYNVTYEADVPYVRRLLVDRDLVVDYSDSVVFVDIEVDDRCVKKGTLILTSTGYEPVEKLVERKKAGGEVILYPNNRVLEAYEHKVIEKITIITEDGRVLQVSGNTPVLTSRGWVKAREIEEGDKIYVFQCQAIILGKEGGENNCETSERKCVDDRGRETVERDMGEIFERGNNKRGTNKIVSETFLALYKTEIQTVETSGEEVEENSTRGRGDEKELGRVENRIFSRINRWGRNDVGSSSRGNVEAENKDNSHSSDTYGGHGANDKRDRYIRAAEENIQYRDRDGIFEVGRCGESVQIIDVGKGQTYGAEKEEVWRVTDTVLFEKIRKGFVWVAVLGGGIRIDKGDTENIGEETRIRPVEVKEVRKEIGEPEIYFDFKTELGWYVANGIIVHNSGFPSAYGEYKILSIAYSFGGGTEWLFVDDFNTERDMLEYFLQELVSGSRTVFVAYNADFDFGHLRARSARLGIGVEWYDLMHVVDLYAEYKSVVKGLTGYTLLEVARHEGYDTSVKERKKKVSEMSREELREYNVNDVELIKSIDKKYGFVKVKLRLAEYVNLTLDNLTPVRIGDSLLLRRARELGYVLRNSVRGGRKKGYEGAFVMSPKKLGLIKGVAVYDVNSMYPNIIRAIRIDIGNFKGELLPELFDEILELRKQYKVLYKVTGDEEYNVMQNVLKILANSLYGLFGSVGFRYFDERKAAMVTAKGRETIMRIVNGVEKLGHEVVYGDTDSSFIEVGDKMNDAEYLEWLKEYINGLIKPLSVKLEYVGDMLILAKKRYVFRTLDGSEIVKGIELRRSDWPVLAKRVVSDVVDMIFAGKSKEEINEYLAGIKKRMYAGEFDSELIMSKGIDPRKKYKVNTEHVRAYRKLVKRLGNIPVDRVMYVYVGGSVEPLVDESEIERFAGRLNYGRYWELIRGAVNRLLDVVFRSKGDILSYAFNGGNRR